MFFKTSLENKVKKTPGLKSYYSKEIDLING